MIRKLLLPLLVLGLVVFVRCSENLTDAEFNLSGPDEKGRPPVVESTNNLSYPVIAVDAFGINTTSESFTVQYTGDYPGLTAEEIADIVANGPWYPQKTTGNSWQAEFASQTSADVTYIDWGDNIESVNPKIRRPFRLEVTLYKALTTPMEGYTMAVLEYPSSSSELQGTNTTTYNSNYATVISKQPKLTVQYLGTTIPSDLTWNVTHWTSATTTLTLIPVSFAPELNVGGKYIFGASTGGWKPTTLGYYRITFYVPSGSGVNLDLASINNASSGFSGSSEGTAATPVVVPEYDLTYVDVRVTGSGGSGGGGPNRP